MIAVSSIRKFSECAEYKKHQIEAFHSWLPHFDKIFYLADKEPELENPKVKFIPCKEWPRIKDLIGIAAKEYSRYVTILNGDIVLTKGFKHVMERMEENHICAAFSKRYNYDPPDFNSGRITDAGIDIFVSTPQVWRKAHTVVPNSFRIGHYLWDSWMSGFLNVLLKSKSVDFTNFRCVFHPVHGSRSNPHVNEIDIKNLRDRYLQHAGMPARKLK